jgi:hypothetical protein
MSIEPETREVTFIDTGETRRVPITHWLPPKPSREIFPDQQQRYRPSEPDWRRILPDYMVEPRVGGYYARRR